MARYSQTDAIVDHLKKFGSITSIEAFSDYGITRLSAIIFNLRKRGMDISSEDIHITNRFGGKVTFSKYIFKDN